MQPIPIAIKLAMPMMKMTEALQAVDEIGINIISILVDPPGA
ncbi:MAG: hypothetical protein ACJZ02_02335 [Candidatus Neomarinimicrobiota bacterium]